MEVTAKLNHLRISPRKVRLTAGLIRGLRVAEAEAQLKFLPNRSSRPIEKLLKSAVANAENNNDLVKDNLYISKIVVDAGPTLKRWRARAHGRAAEIMKRTSRITLVLSEIKSGVRKQEKGKVKKGEIPVEKIDDSRADRNIKTKQYTDKVDKKSLRHQNVGGGRKMFRRKSI